MNGTFLPVQERLFPAQEPVRRVRRRRIILAVGEAQIQNHAFQLVGGVEPVVSRFNLVRQPERHLGHAQVSIRFIVHGRPAQQRTFRPDAGRRAIGDKNHSRIKLIQQPLHLSPIRLFFAHVRQVGAQQPEDFLKMRQVVRFCA